VRGAAERRRGTYKRALALKLRATIAYCAPAQLPHPFTSRCAMVAAAPRRATLPATRASSTRRRVQPRDREGDRGKPLRAASIKRLSDLYAKIFQV
jgi:hypothetical protein